MLSLFPENIGTYGKDIDNLFWLIFVIVTIAMVISMFALIYPLFKYNSKRQKKAAYFDGTLLKHKKWTYIPEILLTLSYFVILFFGYKTFFKIHQQLPDVDLHIAITGRQWNWIFTYPGPDNQLYTPDDIVIDSQNSELHIPVNKNIAFDLKSRDVLHSFSCINIRLKQDAVPGRTITRWFKVTKTGKYEIQCAEICGILHSKMRNYLMVEDEKNFKSFLTNLYDNTSKTKMTMVTNNK